MTHKRYPHRPLIVLELHLLGRELTRAGLEVLHPLLHGPGQLLLANGDEALGQVRIVLHEQLDGDEDVVNVVEDL